MRNALAKKRQRSLVIRCCSFCTLSVRRLLQMSYPTEEWCTYTNQQFYAISKRTFINIHVPKEFERATCLTGSILITNVGDD